MTAEKKDPENGLRRALDIQLIENLMEVAELRGEMRSSLQSLNEKIDRLLALQEKVECNSQAIVRLKAIWSFVAAGIALATTFLKDWVCGQKRSGERGGQGERIRGR